MKTQEGCWFKFFFYLLSMCRDLFVDLHLPTLADNKNYSMSTNIFKV